jgi:hypothetical protein
MGYIDTMVGYSFKMLKSSGFPGGTLKLFIKLKLIKIINNSFNF